MDGVIMASPTPLGDESNSGIQLFQAILAEYDPGFGDYTEGLTTFITVYSAWQSLDGIGEEITSDTIRTTVHGMEQEDLVTGAGLGFRCNGKAAPQTPAVCTRGALRVTLDGEGKPILPYEPFGTSPIPD
jgi:branched-chain amino acid transport system substrate-binding protein